MRHGIMRCFDSDLGHRLLWIQAETRAGRIWVRIVWRHRGLQPLGIRKDVSQDIGDTIQEAIVELASGRLSSKEGERGGTGCD